jgi:serine/threonine protein kinase
VYRARDTRLSRVVALKILPLRSALAADRLGQFRREAQALAALNHQNIGAIYGLEESNGVHALVLELVEGQTLADRLDAGPIPLDEVIAIGRQLAEGLESAHERGIVHNDLKPQNITLRPDGAVKVLDFGVATVMPREGGGPGRCGSRRLLPPSVGPSGRARSSPANTFRRSPTCRCSCQRANRCQPGIGASPPCRPMARRSCTSPHRQDSIYARCRRLRHARFPAPTRTAISASRCSHRIANRSSSMRSAIALSGGFPCQEVRQLSSALRSSRTV